MIGKTLNSSLAARILSKSSISSGLAGIGAVGTIMGGLKMKEAANSIMHGTSYTTPLFTSSSQSKMYGKRGIDANRLSTNGLTQSLHSNRRRS